MSQAMKEVICPKYGAPDVLILKEVAKHIREERLP